MSRRDPLTKEERRGKALEGERAFKHWLDACSRRFVYVDQAPETFAALFRGEVKRPDFLVLIDSIGLIAVDVKNQALTADGYMTLGKDEEIKRTLAFERLFRIPLWYAYFVKEAGRPRWLWISASRVLESALDGQTRDAKKYLKLHPKHFEVLETSNDFGKLFSYITK